jgi:hypothetical protein
MLVYRITFNLKVVKLMNALGYKDIDRGMCMGITLMAAQASLLGQEGISSFFERLKYIEELDLDKLDNIQNPKLTDLIAFLDGVFFPTLSLTLKKPYKC